jgi:hypothetical protein
MIQKRRGLSVKSQDEIGWDLGLIVPPEFASDFTRVRTGPEPIAGFGTQTSIPEFSIENYFDRNGLPLTISKLLPNSIKEMMSTIELELKQENDIVLCFNSQCLFGDGDIEHASLIESFDMLSNRVTIIDPAIGAPKVRSSTFPQIFDAIKNHGVSENSGLWIISDRKCCT